MGKKLIIIGASGHGKVIADIALKIGYDIQGFLDDNDSIKEILGFPVLGSVDKVEEYQNKCEFVIAIGNNCIREKIAKQYDVQWATLIHPNAVIGIDVEIGEGTVVMANAVINSSTIIGRGAIINTGATVDHDNDIGNYTHVSVGAHLAGKVTIGEHTWIGAGAVIINNTNICADCMIGAGAIVIRDIEESGTYVGIPASRIG